MAYRFEIQKQALLDTKKAYEWYESKKEGLGKEFLAEIDDSYYSISENPERFGFFKGSCIIEE